MQTLEELRSELFYMDSDELKGVGRLHQSDPASTEFLEARAEWLRRQQALRVKQDAAQFIPDGPTSEEFSEMAKAAGRRYPWVRYPEE